MKSEKANRTEKVFMAGIFALLLLMAAGFLAYSFTRDKVAAEVALAAILTGMAWFGAFFLIDELNNKRNKK